MRFFILLLLTSLIVGVAGFFSWYHWDSGRNRGSESGYYGEFNRTSNALALIPGVTITQSWHNLDVTLEEFGFSLSVTGQPVRLYFGETDPIRTLGRDAAVAALQKRITAELAAAQTNR